MKRSKVSTAAVFIGAIIFAVCSFIFGIWKGSEPVALQDLMSVFHLSDGPVDETLQTIIWQIRFPRVLLAFFVGASLSLAGAAFQYLLQNPLADPYTLGVSSGASVGAVSVLYWGISLPFLGNFTLPVVSVLCAMGTIFFLLFFVRLVDRMLRIETLILSGVILGSFLGSVLSLLMAFSDDELKSIVSWLLGSVSYRSMDHVWLLLPFFILGLVVLLFLAPQIQALALGEERAHYLGVNVKVVKYSVLIVAALLTGASVSVSGSIAFVGLVIPHAVRMLNGPNVRQTFVLCTIIGGGALVWTDILSRSIAAPLELPIGVVTSFVGAPVFAYIMYKERRKKYS